MAARGLHLVTSGERTASSSGVCPRARPIDRANVRSADRFALADVLDAVMTDLGITNGQLAAWCDEDEKVVRCWRLGYRPFAHRLDDMRSVGAEFRRRTQGAA